MNKEQMKAAMDAVELVEKLNDEHHDLGKITKFSVYWSGEGENCSTYIGYVEAMGSTPFFVPDKNLFG